MPSTTKARQAREALDQRLEPLRPVTRYAVPHRGWIRAIRDALGMPAAALARRMGVTGATVRALEKNEVSGGIRLSSLRRAAEAMDCTLVYAFLPNQGLEKTVRERAMKVLTAQESRIQQTMLLEDQTGQVMPSVREAQLQAIIDSGDLWSPGRGQE